MLPRIDHRLLSADEERALAARIQGDDPDDADAAVRELVECNLCLAAREARRRRPQRGVDVEDLFDEAVLGLYRAARQFDPDKGRFSTCAWWWIRHQIEDAIANQYLIRVERKVYQMATWPEERLATVVDVRRETLAKARRALFGMTSLDDHEPMAGREGRSQDPDEPRDFWPLVDRLDPREAEVIRRRFGPRKESLKQVGRDIGVTKERVRQIQVRAIARLRDLAGVGPS